ncbi:MAG: two-component system response regulator [Candidatus Thiodiazotropha sp.]
MNSEKPKILIVDDEKFYIDVLMDLLKDNYKIIVAIDGDQALRRAASQPPPDLILLDILMPEMDGYEVCRQLKKNPLTQQIPVIFLTVKSEVADELKGFDLGAVDYISKPMSPPVVKARVSTHIYLSKARKQLADQNHLLEDMVQDRTQELSRTKDVAIYCMASLAETRDTETGKHILRTQHYILLLARKLKEQGLYADYLDDTVLDLLYKTSPLHDIGKVGVADRILLKPGKLNPEEWELMKKHAQYGHDALLRAEQEFGTTDFLVMAREIAYTHHERWDGTGYPQGLKGNAIPVPGRLMAIADVYDALVNKRVYKEPYPHEQAVEIIHQASGSHFDPVMVEAFLSLQNEFKRIATDYADSQLE